MTIAWGDLATWSAIPVWGGSVDYRWKFEDPTTLAVYYLPRNPRAMGPTHVGEVSIDSIDTGDGRGRGIATPKIREWSFTGRVHSYTDESDLRTWCDKEYPINITDHFGQTWSVLILRPEFTEIRSRSFRADYTINCYILGGPA